MTKSACWFSKAVYTSYIRKEVWKGSSSWYQVIKWHKSWLLYIFVSKALVLLTVQSIYPCEYWIQAIALPFNTFESFCFQFKCADPAKPLTCPVPDPPPILDPILRTTAQWLISRWCLLPIKCKHELFKNWTRCWGLKEKTWLHQMT